MKKTITKDPREAERLRTLFRLKVRHIHTLEVLQQPEHSLLDKPLGKNTLKLETGNAKVTSAEISRVKNRMSLPVRQSLKLRREAVLQQRSLR